MTDERVPEWLAKQREETGIYWSGKYEPDLTKYPTWQDCFDNLHTTPNYFATVIDYMGRKEPSEQFATKCAAALHEIRQFWQPRSDGFLTNMERDFLMWEESVMDIDEPVTSRIIAFLWAYNNLVYPVFFTTPFVDYRKREKEITDILRKHFPEMRGWF